MSEFERQSWVRAAAITVGLALGLLLAGAARPGMARAQAGETPIRILRDSVTMPEAAFIGSKAVGSTAARPTAADSTAVRDSAAIAVPSPPARDYLAEARASFTPESRAYQRARVWLALFSPLVSILTGLLLMFTGVAARFRDIA